MGGDLVGANTVGLHLLPEESNEGIFLSRIQALLVIVPEEHNAKIALILGADMGALP